MDRFHRALLVAGLFLLAMTQSGSGAKVLKGRPHLTPICNVGFHIEMGGFMGIAAIDARQRRHDMAAGAALKQSLTELIRIIRKVWAQFSSFRLEKDKTIGVTWLLVHRLR